ncbi:MAG: DMT family transporter [Dysgonamonadaceae bacterium]|jgi:drug/metabolite transporter (DMT)-like permease|nr:DMT family transporter [Dysgonamonadaceae bacterium]
MNKTKLQGHLIIAFVNILFAVNMIISKSLLLHDISPEGLTLARTLFACIAFWGTSLFIREKVEKKDLFMLFLCGMLGIAINQALFIDGLNSTSPVDASILVTCTPMFVMVFAFFLLKEPITWKKTGGVIIGAAGAILLITSGKHVNTGSGSLNGNLMVISSGFSYALYLVIAKPLTLKYNAVTIMKWMFLFSTIVLLPFDYHDLTNAPLLSGNPEYRHSLLLLAYVLFGATFITYLLIPIALKKIRPTTVSMYNYLQPIIAAFIAVVIGQDHFSWEKIGAALMVFLGVYLVTISKSRADLEKEDRKSGRAEDRKSGRPEDCGLI